MKKEMEKETAIEMEKIDDGENEQGVVDEERETEGRGEGG